MLTLTGSGQICHPQLFIATEDGLCNPDPYVLMFEDNFDGDSLDLSKWQIQPWGQGSLVGDNTQQYYSLDNATVSAGICTIAARRDTVLRRAVSWKPDDEILADGLPNLRTYYFTSSNLWTNGQFGNGIYEIRCRIPSGKGFWPAFWMYGADSASNREIDVFEFWDDNTSDLHMTVHYNGQMCESDDTGPDYSLAFHTFKVICDDYQVEWYVDSVLKRKITKFNTLLGQNVNCDEVENNHLYLLEKSFPSGSMNIIMNLAIQTGMYAPDTSTSFPAMMDIDYIRFYAQVPSTGLTIVEDTSRQHDMNVKIITYPNPSSGVLSVTIENKVPVNYEISLLNEQGEIIFQSKHMSENTFNIDISGCKKGIYVLHIVGVDHKNEYTRKIIFN